MELNKSSFRNKHLQYLQNTPQDEPSNYQSLSLPTSGCQSNVNITSQKKNRLLDRIRSQLTNIKSQVFNKPRGNKSPIDYRDDYSPARSNDSNKLDRSVDRESISNRYQSRIPTEPTQSRDMNYYKFQNQKLAKDCKTLRQKLYEKQERYKNQKAVLNGRISELECRLSEKENKLDEYESELQDELERFKEEMKEQSDQEGLKKRIFYLQSVIQQNSNQIMYLKKRTSDDALQIKRYTIQNYQLKKQYNMSTQPSSFNDEKLYEKIRHLQMQLDRYKLDDTKIVQEINLDQQPKESIYETKKRRSVKDYGIGDNNQVSNLKESYKFVNEELKLQQNTIDVLEFQLSKALKQAKKAQIKSQEDLRNAKTTYQRLLESVKEGLTQCYRAQIEDLRNQLNIYTRTNSERTYDESLDINMIERNPAPSRQSKVVTAISSEIIIVEEDQSLQSTERKNVTPEGELASPREELKRRVEYLEGVILMLEKEIQQLKWVKEGTSTPIERPVINNIIEVKYLQNQEDIQELQAKNMRLTECIQSILKEREDLIDQLAIKDIMSDLVDQVTGKVIQEEMLSKQCLNSVNSEMQFIIQKLKLRNYESQKKVKEAEKTIQLQNRTIDQLRHSITQIQIKSSEQAQINKIIINKVHSLEEENIRLNGRRDQEKEKLQAKLQQLHQYKSALQAQITKRENKINILKDQISNIVGQQDRKKQRSYNRQNETEKQKMKNREEETIARQMNEIDELRSTIKGLSQEIHQLKIQHNRKKTGEFSQQQTNEIKQLKTELMKKNEQIYQYKNENAVTRLRCDSLKSQQEVQRLGWATEKKNLEIKLQRQIQNLLRDLSLQKQTVQFLTSQIKSFQSEVSQKDQIIKKVFSRIRDQNQNIPSIQKRTRVQSFAGEKSRFSMARKLSESNKSSSKQLRDLPKITQIQTLELNL